MTARAALAVAVALAAAGCGGGDAGGPRLTVSAASSLKEPLAAYADGFRPAAVRLAFGGSDALAAQVRRGVRPDVLAAADSRLPAALHAAGLADAPVVFATNRLAIAVRPGGRVRSLADLESRGVRIAVGAAGVPVGDYARRLLDRLAPADRAAIERNVRTREPDVAGAVGKLLQGAVDAAIVYETDVGAARGRLDSVALPDRLQPDIRYAAVVVAGSRHPAQARAFVDGLRTAPALREAGFGPPP